MKNNRPLANHLARIECPEERAREIEKALDEAAESGKGFVETVIAKKKEQKKS